MKQVLAACLLSVAISVNAQPVTVESIRLAEAIIESTWSAWEETLPMTVASFESQMKANGVSERAAKVFGEEVGRRMTRDSITKATAMAITAKLSSEEIRDVSAFLRTKAGKKFMTMNNDFATNAAYAMPLTKEACAAALRRMEASPDRQSLDGVCRQF